MEQFSFSNVFWILLFGFTLLPWIRQKKLEAARMALIRSVEKLRGTRVITMIHRQETMALLGFPLRRYIDIEDSEQVLRAVRLTPDDMPIDLVLHTPGGLVLASEQIARALRRHPAKVTVVIPHYAMSGGTLIALAADEILLDENAVLGPVDPQIDRYPASSILRVLREKPIHRIDDTTIMLGDVAEKAIRQIEDSVAEIAADRMSAEDARQLAKKLSDGRWTHDHPLMCSTLQSMGLPVSCNIPAQIYKLMNYYPQPLRGTPSVDFVPIPYKKGNKL